MSPQFLEVIGLCEGASWIFSKRNRAVFEEFHFLMSGSFAVWVDLVQGLRHITFAVL